MFDVIFAVMVILASSFSAYTTFLGFGYDLPWGLALPLAVLIGLGLIGVNFKIRDARTEGDSIARPFLAFLVLFVFSFVSNTNAIYTFFVRKDIVGQTQEEAWRVFEAETGRIQNAVAADPRYRGYVEASRKLDVERVNLRKQITDQRNPGRGELAKVHLEEIGRILGMRLTDQRPPAPTASMQELEAYADKVDRMIGEQAEIQFRANPGRQAEALLEKIQKTRELYKGETVSGKYNSATTELMRQDLHTFTEDARPFTNGLVVAEINSDADETGSFNYTWANFVHWINPAAIVLSVLLGTMLDILPPLMSILLYKQEEGF